jgi:hypothetical protein
MSPQKDVCTTGLQDIYNSNVYTFTIQGLRVHLDHVVKCCCPVFAHPPQLIYVPITPCVSASIESLFVHVDGAPRMLVEGLIQCKIL